MARGLRGRFPRFANALSERSSEEVAGLHPMRGVMGTGIDTAGFGMILAKVAGGRLFLHHGFFLAGMLVVIGLGRKGMQVDIAVRAIFRAQAAADAPVFDDDLERIAAAN